MVKVFYPVGIENVWHHNADNTKKYRLDGIEKLVRLKDILEKDSNFKVVNIDGASTELFEEVHAEEYVKALLTGHPKELAESSGLIWQQSLPQAFANAAQSVTDSCFEALKNGISAAISSGGHHALRERGFGFNPISEVAIAVESLLKVNPKLRIVILDLDVHLGNGWHTLLKDREGVFLYDIWNKTQTIWSIPADSNNIDSIYVKTIEEYKIELGNTLDQIVLLEPDLLIYHSGADVVSSDRLGGIEYFTTDEFEAREKLVISTCKSNNIPITLVLGGGYVDYNYPAKSNMLMDRLVDLHYFSFKTLSN